MRSLGIVYSITGQLSEKYWLASRAIRQSSTYVYFGIRTTGTTLTSLGSDEVFGSSESVAGTGQKQTAKFRPVITLRSNLKITGGNGKRSEPYSLGT